MMSRTDQWVIAMMLLLVVIHLAVGIAGYVTGRFICFITLLNLMAGLSIIIYWIQQQVRITQHVTEQRELLVLLLETMLAGSAAYFLMSGRAANFTRIVQCIFFGIHLLLLLLGLVFMLSFKMNKLL